MKKVAFSIGGRGFDVELENEFAEYVQGELKNNEIFFDRNNEVVTLLKAYMKSLKKNYDTEKKIETLLTQISR